MNPAFPSTPVRLLGAIVAALLLASCGGGDPAAGGATATAADGRKKAQAVFVPTTTIPADANTRGMWSSVYNWPLIPLHTVLMPDGRVLTYGSDSTGTQTGNFIYDVWDPEGGLSGGHTTLPNNTGTDLFCSSQLVLPAGGAVFIAGGDIYTNGATTNVGNNNSNLFTYGSNALARGVNMNRPRWYSSSITLPNGETYIQGGSGGVDRPEVRGTGGTFRLLSNADTSSLNWYYPRNFVTPDGRIFGFDTDARAYYVDPTGTGTLNVLGQFDSSYFGVESSSAMFRPGRILQFGGNSNGATVIDVSGSAPTFTPTQPMSSQRRWVTGTVLPNGRVLATGGSQIANQLTNVNNSAEMWDPDSGTWTVGSSGSLARLYHSVALLLPDGTVLVGGGGAPGPLNNLNVELYYPPYLFTAGGVLAPRPSIATAPTVLDIGKTFRISATGNSGKPVSRVVLVKAGSVTHSFNMEQRFIDLTFNAGANSGDFVVQAPTRAGEAPPGFYLLFVLDSAGTPSVAKMLRMNVAATPNPATVPAITTPAAPTSASGSAVSVAISATDPNGDTLTYGASGLPPGLTIDAATGRITGTPTTAGSYATTVTASDGINVASVSFTWTVTGQAPLAVSPVQPTPALAGSNVALTATASNALSTLRYKWSFGDGTADTAYATSPSVTHVFAQPGLYVVTVTAIDSRNVEARQTLQQAVYKAATAQRPTGSSAIVVEPRTGANARVWVANPDNDTVSVFDAVTRAKQAEIAVGDDPRSIAVAPNGMVWVTNKGTASISVINAGTLALSRTIALPRGSRPHGLAMLPANGTALVVLEASGQLLKFNTSSYAQVTSLAVGANPRHVSASGDGTRAWVSRFITPPLPGEGTATVNTTGVGGELLVVATGGASGAMSLTRTVLLAHSERPDAENQGRGIPNYLGAAAVSPDGTQAFVPSKQDNIKRGSLRDGNALNFQNTVRAVSSRIDLSGSTTTDDLANRIDHDNASLASAAIFDTNGNYLFVALETSREVAVIDAWGRRELLRFDVGRAPQGLALSPDGKTLFVSNFMDRSVGAYDLRPLVTQGQLSVPVLGTLAAVATEKLSATVLKGKQFFYDARDPRLARDRYMSCASCHNDAGHDGRTWDFTGQGEGLRNTIALRGRAGMGQGFLHWSANFDETQDFEGQIRALAGGTGLMSDALFNAGTRSQPLGDTKAGQSADLDALSAYLASQTAFDAAPARPSATTLSATASAGRTLFASLNCAACHGGAAFTNSAAGNLVNIGTVKPSSGKRLYGTLTGIDIPTLRDVWATAPYLHDGSAATLEAAITAHNNVSTSAANIAQIAQYLREIGTDEGTAPLPAGTGLSGSYYRNTALSGFTSLTRVEAVDFDWGNGAPASGLPSENFSVRWTGSVMPEKNGSYQFQTVSDDGVRLWINGVLVINNWTTHGPTTDTSANVTLVAGQKVTVKLEYFEQTGGATIRLRWAPPGSGGSFVAIPSGNLFPN